MFQSVVFLPFTLPAIRTSEMWKLLLDASNVQSAFINLHASNVQSAFINFRDAEINLHASNVQCAFITPDACFHLSVVLICIP